MKKGLRDIIKAADDLGLKIKKISDGSKHTRVTLVNKDGVAMILTATIHPSNSMRAERNNLASMRRLARGQTHGLIIENAKPG